MAVTRCEIVAFHTDDPREKALARQAAESVYTEEECQALQGPHKVSTVWHEHERSPLGRSLLIRSDIDNERATWSDSPHLIGD